MSPAKTALKKEDVTYILRDLEDGSKALGIFNRGTAEATAAVKWSEINLSGIKAARDLWRQKDVPDSAGGLSVTIPAGGCYLFKLQPLALVRAYCRVALPCATRFLFASSFQFGEGTGAPRGRPCHGRGDACVKSGACVGEGRSHQQRHVCSVPC